MVAFCRHIDFYGHGINVQDNKFRNPDPFPQKKNEVRLSFEVYLSGIKI